MTDTMKDVIVVCCGATYLVLLTIFMVHFVV